MTIIYIKILFLSMFKKKIYIRLYKSIDITPKQSIMDIIFVYLRDLVALEKNINRLICVLATV